MNSYPAELLAQHEPLMFAAGLDLPPAPGQRSPPESIPTTPNGTQTVISSESVAAGARGPLRHSHQPASKFIERETQRRDMEL